MDWPLEQWDRGEAQGWIRGFPDVLSWRATRRRRFWCSLTRLDVEVEFEERGLPGFRCQSGVLTCSVFDPPTAVACRRRCLDSRFRRQWDSALPVYTGRPR